MIKSRLRMSLAASLFLAVTLSVANAQYSGGSGTAEDPYQIATAADLIALGETPDDYDKHFILTGDIDLDPNLRGGKVFDRAVIAPYSAHPFEGVFDGNGHQILNMTISGVTYIGLFGSVDTDGEILNLGLEAATVAGAAGWAPVGVGVNHFREESEYVGGLVGLNDGHVSGCHCTGVVTGDFYVGGLVGCSDGVIANSRSGGSVSGSDRSYSVGGLVGDNGRGRITSCYSTSRVDGNREVGGLAGSSGGNIADCYSNGMTTGWGKVGGLVGNNVGTVTGSHSRGMVSGDHVVGGLVGSNDDTLTINDGTITMTCSTGPVEGGSMVGGLVGENKGRVTQSCSSSRVSGGDVVGGLVGTNGRSRRTPNPFTAGSISNSYFTGSVGGDNLVGGLVGSNVATSIITASYSSGSVSGEQGVGGFAGVHNAPYPSGTITTSFWNIETSEQASSGGGTGLTTAEMQTAATFLDVGWDFIGETENGPNDVWKIVEGQTYPLLSWQKYGGGSGEPNDPYLIYTAEHLNALGAEPNDYDKHFKLMADIDLVEFEYTMAVIAPDIGGDGYTFSATAFTGVFDGNGCAVSNLTITGQSYLGLFGQVGPGGQVHGLGVVNVNITGSYYAIGALVGDNDRGRITRSYSTGTVTGYNFVGGLVGYNNYGDIALSYSHCLASGTSSGNQGIGGLVGVTAGSITRSYSTGDVSGQRKVGGLVGRNYQSNITNCYSTGPVSGDSDIGGLVGASNDGTTTASFWDMDASGQSTSAGGTGRTRAEMQTGSTFLEVGWDFVHETENGAEDIWKIAEGLDCPRLWWEEYDGQVTVELGQQFTVRLESNPSTGYRWEWVDRQASILEQIGEAQFKPRETGDPPLVGAGGWDIFTFEAASSGQMTLELVYCRPWEEGMEPLKTFSLQVVVP